MKQCILNNFIRAAAIAVLPVAAWAEDSATSQIGGGSATSLNSGPIPGTSMSSSQGSGGTFSTQASNPSGGILVHDGAAYIVHRLQSEMSLPDGSKVQPNGTITGRDGATRSVGQNQMLTLDGQVTEAPFIGGSSTTSSSSMSRSMSGDNMPGSSMTPGSTTSGGSPAGAAMPNSAIPPSAPVEEMSNRTDGLSESAGPSEPATLPPGHGFRE